MPAVDLLSYWRPDTADREIRRVGGGLLNHAASNQFKRMKPDDTVWITTVRTGRLFLLGRIVVGQVTNRDGAVRALGTEDLWEASHHIIAAAGTARSIANVDVQSLAAQLRFRSSAGNDRLSLDGGAVRAQQLQTMRILTCESAQLLERALQVTL